MFNRRLKERIKELEWIAQNDQARIQRLALTIKEMNDVQPSMADLMQQSLGMQIDFSAADKKTCLPPHYFDDLTTEERANFVADMETIYANQKFQSVVKYWINVFALSAVYKAEEIEKVRNQAAVIGFRALLNDFDKMHLEFMENRREQKEEFDTHEIL